MKHFVYIVYFCKFKPYRKSKGYEEDNIFTINNYTKFYYNI